MNHRRHLAAGSAATLVLALGSVGTAAASPRSVASASAAAATAAYKFTPGLALLDDKGANPGAAEPSIRVDRNGHIYVIGPVGVPTGGCPMWRVHPGFPGTQNRPYNYLGRPDLKPFGAGGGDCDVATGGLLAQNGFDNVAVSSLSLASLTTNRSSDGGQTFERAPNPVGEGQVFGVDRQWQAADYGLQQNYITVHDLATANIQVSDSSDGGYVYKSNRPAINFNQVPSAISNNELGNVVVNQNTHKIYTIFIAPQPTNINGPLDTVYEAVGNPCAVRCNPGQPLGPISWTNHMIYHDTSGATLDHIFPVTAVDAGGNVYATWSTTTQAFLTHSTAAATKWSKPIGLDGAGSNSVMFPWMVGGKSGVVDVVYYEGFLGSKCAATGVKDNSQGANNNCHNVWNVELAQVRNATSGTPTIIRSNASSVIHNGSICDNGLNCNLANGDRTLLDYFQVDLDPAGAANIAYASDSAHPGTAEIDYTRQCTGLSAKSDASVHYSCSALVPPPPTFPQSSCDGVNVVTDPGGDATNPTGLPGSTDQVDITNISFTRDTTGTTPATKLTTKMTLKSLTNPPMPITGTDDTFYYVVWKFGTKFYASLAQEPDPSGVFEFSYGEFNPSNNQLTTSNPTTGSITGNTISVNVPLAGVGKPTIPAATDANAGVNDPYGLTISGEGALGNGLVFIQPDDRAPNSGGGSDWAVCPAA